MLKLKHFSLISPTRTFHYDDLIVPFLQRLINLEKLELSLHIIRIDSHHIDGNHLHDEILCSMPRLKKFRFNLETTVQKTKDIVLASNDQIQRTLIQRGFQSVGSYVETFSPVDGTRVHVHAHPYEFASRSHVYSLPFQFKQYPWATNWIPSGIFHSVVTLSVTDNRSFEHEFFRLVSQSFPLLKNLYVVNGEPQTGKHEPRRLVTFSRLIHLDVRYAHRDYAENLLIDEWCHLPRLVDLEIGDESLVSVTNCFTNDATRLSCNRLRKLHLKEQLVHPEHFSRYFPSL